MDRLGIVFAAALGIVIGWLIKNKILEVSIVKLRKMRFKVDNKIGYSELINELVPILTPLGMVIEKSADEDGCPIVSYQSAMYDIRYNDDSTFCVWWRKNLLKAIFMVDNIGAYRKAVVAMGIIAYHVQQICAGCSNNEKKNVM